MSFWPFLVLLVFFSFVLIFFWLSCFLFRDREKEREGQRESMDENDKNQVEWVGSAEGLRGVGGEQWLKCIVWKILIENKQTILATGDVIHQPSIHEALSLNLRTTKQATQTRFRLNSFSSVFWEGQKEAGSQRWLFSSGVDFHLCTVTGPAETTHTPPNGKYYLRNSDAKGQRFLHRTGLNCLPGFFLPLWTSNRMFILLASMVIFINGESEIHLCVWVTTRSLLACQII